jgi:hypothetical protein
MDTEYQIPTTKEELIALPEVKYSLGQISPGTIVAYRNSRLDKIRIGVFHSYSSVLDTTLGWWEDTLEEATERANRGLYIPLSCGSSKAYVVPKYKIDTALLWE